VESLLKWISCVQLYIEQKFLNWNCEIKCENSTLIHFLYQKNLLNKWLYSTLRAKGKVAWIPYFVHHNGCGKEHHIFPFNESLKW